MAHPVTSTSLIGSKGKVVLNGDGDDPDLPADHRQQRRFQCGGHHRRQRLCSGLDSLAGSNSYTIYKNGTPATAADLKKYDVATYASATNPVIVCDTRVSVYYEDCKPSPSNPTTITVLGGTELNVLPYRCGVPVPLQARPADDPSADGGRSGGRSRGLQRQRCPEQRLAVVYDSGNVQLICGGTLLKINGSGSGYEDSVVKVIRHQERQ